MNHDSKLGALSHSITGFFFRKKPGAELPPPRLTGTEILGNGFFQFQVSLPKGTKLEIQVSRDLKNWAALSSHTAEKEALTIVDNEAPKLGWRFYRGLANQSVYSINTIGFLTISLPPGFSMIAQPFHRDNSRLDMIMPIMPEGTTFNKFDTTLFRLTKNSYSNGKWANPGEVLNPGEGGLISNPSEDFRKITFWGEVLDGDLSLPIPAGFSIRSSLLPLPGVLDADLGFPISNGDVIHLYDRDQQKYAIYTYESNKWTPSAPVLGVGEAFWIGKTAAGNWVQARSPKQASVQAQ